MSVCACASIDPPRLLSAAASIFSYCSDSEKIIFATLAIYYAACYTIYYGVVCTQYFFS